MKRISTVIAAGLLMLTSGIVAPSARAEDRRFEFGVRYIVVGANGEPTNDQMGVGISGRYRLGQKWLVGASIDQVSGDVERAYEFFGNTSPEELDSKVDSTIITGWIEREYTKPDHKLAWFWNVGLGFTSPDVDDLAGPLTGGGTFDITTDPGSETLLYVAGGLRRRFSRHVGFEVAVRADRHFADWKLTDRTDGSTATIDDYTTKGVHLGLRFTF